MAFDKNQELENKSHYAKQYCEYPWTSNCNGRRECCSTSDKYQR